MLRLHAKVEERWTANPFVARLVEQGAQRAPQDVGFDVASRTLALAERDFKLPEGFAHLTHGDILRLSPTTGDVNVLYRVRSTSNAILVTEKCSSYCLMCSQPPKDIDDSFLFDVWQEAIPLM